MRTQCLRTGLTSGAALEWSQNAVSVKAAASCRTPKVTG
jgi:hypothetical protein